VLTFFVAAALLSLVLAAVASFIVWANRHSVEPPLAVAPMGPAWVGRALPQEPRRAFMAAILSAALLGVALVLIGVLGTTRGLYGWTLFVVAPFAMGFVAASLTTYRQPPTVWRFTSAATFAALVAGLAFLALGVEGLVCLLMAAPITVPCSVVGSLAAYLVYVQRRAHTTASAIILCLVPLGLIVESGVVGPPPESTVRTSIDIAASPSAVWAHLVEFDPIASPVDEWFFRAGVAYPISARLLGGRGVGATRVCDFSTGRFVETVRVWDEARRLMFTIEEGPPVLREWTPYTDIHPPHVEGYFVPDTGDFRLVPLPGGGTRLVGTSVYRNRMWPSQYWRLWSDAIVTRVHRRVFQHIKQLAERDQRR
jgi:hypothetical protein